MLSILCNLKASNLLENDFLFNNYENILNSSELYKNLINAIYNELSSNSNPTHSKIINSLDISKNLSELLAVGISCLQLFVQSNWLGPPIDTFSFMSVEKAEFELYEEKLKNLLILDGESILMKVNNLHYIFISRIIFIDFYDIISSIKVIIV